MRSFVSSCIVPAARPTRGSGLGGVVDMFAGVGSDEEDDDIVEHAPASTTPAASDTVNREETGFTRGAWLRKRI
jgi:hypothetical protein